MGFLKPWHIAVLVVVLILLFGAKRLPDAARSLGRSLRIFKAETKNLMDDDVKGKAEAHTTRGAITPEIPDDQPSPLPKVEPIDHRRDTTL
jgi:sec-independent protein translocase protein TatA